MAVSSRWRLIELRGQRDAVRGGIELLDRKREALVRHLAGRRRSLGALRASVGASLQAARRALHAAIAEVGRPACEAAALAQRLPGALSRRDDRVLGVRLPRVVAALHPLEIAYGPGGTSAALDRAAREFAALLPALVDLGSEETAVHNLETALHRTNRTLNALRDRLLPAIEAEIGAVANGLEEEERDERVRWSRR